MTVAALYVEEGGVYYGLPDVDPWPESRDARKYPGPYPVIAHPDCARWGRYANGGPGFRGAVRPTPGDDGGCFEAAFNAVQTWGGVLEHPAGSLAFKKFGIRRPARDGDWSWDRTWNVWVCRVEQGHYGHRARKATWLIANVKSPPPLIWGPSSQQLLRAAPGRRATRTGVCQNLSRKQRRATPPRFAEALLSIARLALPHQHGTP